jgi:hypothetical protein
MARSRSLLNLRGKIQGLVFVKSKTYGKYVRTARGTHKPAEVNAAFKEMTPHLLAAQQPARMIKDAIDRYRPDFMGGSLWNRLVSLFTRQHSNTGNFSLRQLEGMEVFKQFPLIALVKLNTHVAIDRENGTLNVVLSYSKHPRFPKARSIDAYCFQVICIFPDLITMVARDTDMYSPIISLKSKLKELSFSFPSPVGAHEFIICVKLDGMVKNVMMLGRHTKGMCIVKAGRVG